LLKFPIDFITNCDKIVSEVIILLGEKISRLRKDKKLTQQQLANELGIAQSTIGMIERDERGAGSELLLKFANFFGVSVDYLLTTEEKLEIANGAMERVSELIQKALGKPAINISDSIYTITSKYENENFTPEETEEILNFIDFTIAKRKQK
jgi:transcriptional regulator with XRE-family HTH domain